MKIKDKVKVLRKHDNGQFVEVGVGIVKAVHTNKKGEDTYVSFTDKQWANQEVSEILPINAECMKVVKF